MRHRALPPEDWDKLAGYDPFSTTGLPNPDHWRIIVAEDDAGQILGFCALFDAVHWEPWYVTPEARRNPAVIRGLVREGLALLRSQSVSGAFAVVANDQPELHRLMVERFGFVPAPGTLFAIDLDALAEKEF